MFVMDKCLTNTPDTDTPEADEKYRCGRGGHFGPLAASLLSRRHRVHLFEQEGRLGGHTNTVVVNGTSGPLRSIAASWSTTTARRCNSSRLTTCSRSAAGIEVLRADYRELTGRLDKVVSIEMFEAVGLTHYGDYFSAVDRLLAPDGACFCSAPDSAPKLGPRSIDGRRLFVGAGRRRAIRC